MILRMATQLRLVGVRDYVTQDLIAVTFHTALNGITVNCAPHAKSLRVEMESTTHLGKKSQVFVIFGTQRNETK